MSRRVRSPARERARFFARAVTHSQSEQGLVRSSHLDGDAACKTKRSEFDSRQEHSTRSMTHFVHMLSEHDSLPDCRE